MGGGSMKLGLDARGGVDDQLLAFGAQLGATDVIGGGLPEDGSYWEYLDLLRLRTRVESAGMKLTAIENLPQQWMDKIKLGLPGRDQQIDNVCKTIRNMGAAGVPILGVQLHADAQQDRLRVAYLMGRTRSGRLPSLQASTTSSFATRR